MNVIVLYTELALGRTEHRGRGRRGGGAHKNLAESTR